MLSNKQTHEFQFDVEFPKNFISLLKQNGSPIYDGEVQDVINGVNYDIARKLNHSEEWIYALFNILLVIQERTKKVSNVIEGNFGQKK